MTREDDKRVAEIMGFVPDRMLPTSYSGSGIPTDFEPNYPHYTSNPAADYTVLEWVRSGRGIAGSLVWGEFGYQLDMAGRSLSVEYQPGDYSRALLELDKKGVLK